jgi:hypothetical protein
MATAVKAGSAVSAGIEHENYTFAAEPIPAEVRDSLAQDLG